MENDIEIGTVSSRGQICIPTAMRAGMGLKKGARVVFIRVDDSLMMKRVSAQTFEELTKPLKDAARKLGLKESDAADMVHRFRKKR